MKLSNFKKIIKEEIETILREIDDKKLQIKKERLYLIKRTRETNKKVRESMAKKGFKLQEIIEKQVQNEFVEGFDMDLFKSMKSFSKRVKYANEKLQRLASGSSRIIYKIDDKKVLKLAKNAKGIAQNTTEGDWGLNDMYGDIIAKMIDKDDENDMWIVSEYAKKISPNRFKQLLGTDIITFYSYLFKRIEYNQKNNIYVKELDKETIELLENIEFVHDVIDMIINFDIAIGDFMRISTYGEIDGKLVIVDYGLTKSV